MSIQYSLNQGEFLISVCHFLATCCPVCIREFHRTVKERVANYFKENNIVSL